MTKLVSGTHSDRRAFLRASAGAALVTLTPSVFAGQPNKKRAAIDLSSATPEQAVEMYIKMTGSLEPAVVYTWFTGHLWGIVPGTPAKPLVSFDGLAKNLWRSDGDQMTKQSYDVGFFGDVDSGEVIDTLQNPYTGKTVRPYHYAYGGGVTRYAKTGMISEGSIKSLHKKWTVSGDEAWFEEQTSASVVNPFDPKEWPLASAGKNLHFGSSVTNKAKLSDLLDARKRNIPYTLFWTAINSWEPWLLMGDTPGYVMWRATGRKLRSLCEAPKRTLDHINKVQPNYLDDDQPWSGTRSTWADYRRDRKPEST